jgi:dihydrodipicolinate synthase/N-acetylneuraminate lyase
MELNGVYAPLPTPLTDDGSSFSEIRMLRLLKHLQDYGVSGFVACGEVGEFTSTSFSERKGIVETLLRNVAQCPHVIVNVSTLSTTASLDLAQHAGRHGAQACVLMPPYYGTYTDAEVYQFYKIIGQYAGLPVLVVDPRGRIGPDLASELAVASGVFLAGPTFWAAKANGTESRASVDDFAIDPGAATTLALFKPVQRLLEKPEEELRKFSKFIEGNGKARVVKAAFEMMGLELGPLRGPLHSLPIEIQELLRTFLDLDD